MSATDWKPAPLPPSLVGHAKPCPQCMQARSVVSELIGLLSDARRPEAKLQCKGSQVYPNELDIKCGWCRDTGWILDDSLKELVRRARDLLDSRSPATADKTADLPLATFSDESSSAEGTGPGKAKSKR